MYCGLINIVLIYSVRFLHRALSLGLDLHSLAPGEAHIALLRQGRHVGYGGPARCGEMFLGFENCVRVSEAAVSMNICHPLINHVQPTDVLCIIERYRTTLKLPFNTYISLRYFSTTLSPSQHLRENMRRIKLEHGMSKEECNNEIYVTMVVIHDKGNAFGGTLQGCLREDCTRKH